MQPSDLGRAVLSAVTNAGRQRGLGMRGDEPVGDQGLGPPPALRGWRFSWPHWLRTKDLQVLGHRRMETR